MLSGHVAEMATGEGKTLSGALAAAAYALRGRSVHVLSVNDYLARRDAEWMRPVYDLLGVTVGCIGQASAPGERRRAYAAAGDLRAGQRDRLRCAQGPVRHGRGRPGRHRPRRGPDRRGRLGPDRRGAGAAGAGGRRPAMQTPTRRWPRSCAGWSTACTTRSMTRAATSSLTSAGAQAAEEALGGINLYAADQLDTLTRLNVALHAHALLQRDVRLHRPRRQGPPDQRLPRPGGPAAALARRAAGRGRGQGGPRRQRQRRDPGQPSRSSRWSGATRRSAA